MKKFIVMSLLMVVWQVSCGNKEADTKVTKPAPFSGIVVTVQSGGGYSFLEVKGESGNFWAATRPVEVKKGDSVELVHPMKMVEFKVKSLNRTFDVIYFADDVMVNGKSHMKKASESKAMGGMTASPHGKKAGQGMENPHQSGKAGKSADAVFDASDVKPVKGSVAIEKLLKNSENYAGKEVKVHAIVTKFLPMIMKRNWLHLVDASSGAEYLVATTDKTFKVGDTLILSGKVEVNKDFGFGYKYKVLLTQVKAGK